MSTLKIADREFASRLILGTGGFRSLETMERAILADSTLAAG